MWTQADYGRDGWALTRDAVRWRVHRLLSMSSGEMAARSRREIVHRIDDATYRRRRHRWEGRWLPHAGLLGEPAPAAPRGILTRERARWLREADADGAAGIIELARRFRTGTYRYVGHPEVVLAMPPEYDRDPWTGERWPSAHAKRIDYRTATCGDPKWIWELNRLQELPILVEAWLLSDDHDYLEHASLLAENWLSQVEPGRGIAWSNGYEAGLRAISLALLLDAVRGTDLARDGLGQRLVFALWQHGRWIDRDPSTHSSANNHRLGEVAGLTTIGLLAPELEMSRRWVSRGLAELARESTLQIAADGTSAEQAFGYHLHALDFLLFATALLDAARIAVPVSVLDALHRSGTALAAQIGPGEPEPRYGDADGSWVVRLDGGDKRSAHDVAAAIAARLGHSGARRVAGTLDTAARWLFGREGTDTFAATPPAPAPGSVHLPDAGLVILRSPHRRVTFDVGPLGYQSIAAHGHADALSVTIAEAGVELVTDPGVGSYFNRPGLRSSLRGTSAHATVSIDGESQSVDQGPFLWAAHARTSLVSLDLASRTASGEQDGYMRLRPPVSHRRLVVSIPGGPVVVHDRLRGTGHRRVLQSWPLHPSLELVERNANSALFHRSGVPALLLRAAASAPLSVEPSRGGDPDPGRGWYSKHLEHAEPAWNVGFVAELEGILDVVCAILPLAGFGLREPALDLDVERASISVRWATPTGEAALEFDPGHIGRPERREHAGP